MPEASDPPAGSRALTPAEYEPVDRRTVRIVGLALALGIVAGLVARGRSRA